MVFIQEELKWLSEIIILRLKTYFNDKESQASIYSIEPPKINDSDDAYAAFIRERNFCFEERVALALCLAPYIKPELMDCFCIKNSDTGVRFSEFGCIDKGEGKSLVPTLSTVLFVLAGADTFARLKFASFFCSHKFFMQHCLSKEGIGSEADSFSSWLLRPSEELVDTLILERSFQPQFSQDFPAQRISTERSWDELILADETKSQLEEIRLWAKYGDNVRHEWGMEHIFHPGFKALFYGPSGSGKTFTATLLGRETGRDVYRVDLSTVISKYIGETEKNLAKVFKVAEGKNWILFFDEADALFGKRTGIKDSHDRYANQEVAYLLQRIEDFGGLVILSTNLRVNIDDAFSRRFQSIIGFNLPDSKQRLKIWQETFSPACSLEPSIDLGEIARKYELTGGSIVNIVQYCSLMAYSRGETTILKEDLIGGIEREFIKDGKVISA